MRKSAVTRGAAVFGRAARGNPSATVEEGKADGGWCVSDINAASITHLGSVDKSANKTTATIPRAGQSPEFSCELRSLRRLRSYQSA